MDQQELSKTQFSANAANYLASVVHAKGEDLDRLEAYAREGRPEHVLDLGCGAGHASFALARGGVGRVVAYDPSPDMLSVVASEAESRQLSCIQTQVGPAEALPFTSRSFDIVVSRYSAHHWADVPRALAECARVLKAGGRLIVIDAVAPEQPLLDTALQVFEFLRDAGHVRDYRVSEWSAMQRVSGFDEPAVWRWRIPLDFESWVARIATPAARIAALKDVFAGFSGEVREYFRVAADLSFAIDAAWIEAGVA